MTEVYSLTPFQPFSGAVQALIEASDPSLYVAASATQYMGHSYDPVSRRLFFSSNVLIDSISSGSGFAKINDTGYTLYNYPGNVSIAPSASYDGEVLKSFHLHYLDVDTGAVTMIDPFDPTATVPNGKHGSDGSWRLVVASSVNLTNLPQFKMVDPWTGDCWAHMTDPQCNIYVFRQDDGFKQRLLPFGANGHMEMLGMTPNWLLVAHTANGDRSGTTNLYAVPRLTTLDETAEGQLLAYFVAEAPFPDHYWRSLMTPDGAVYFLICAKTGSKNYKLYRYDPPASVGAWAGSPQPGGTFTDITPWSSSTGPNSNCGAWIFDTSPGGLALQRILRWRQLSPFNLPATNQMAFLSILCPQATDSAGTNHDPASFRIDCTYYDIGAATFDYHEGFVTGYMTAAWTPTSDPSEAAFAVQFIRETDNFREMRAFDYGDDYTERWIEFSVQPVVGGSFTWASSFPGSDKNSAVLVKYRFAYGSAPEVIDVRVDGSWLPFYGAYASTIGSDNVVEHSILMDDDINREFAGAENYLSETGFVTGSGIWFGGWNAYSGLIDPTFPHYRGTIFDDWDPYPYPASIVRLSWGEAPAPAYRSSVWSNIGHPQL